MWIYENNDITKYFNNLVNTLCSISFTINSSGSLQFNGKYDPIKNPTSFIDHANKLLIEHTKPRFNLEDVNNYDSWCFPLLQMGQLNIRQDEFVISEILKNIESDSNIVISSPYLNLTSNYKNLLLQSKSENIKILTTSPEANGFYTAKDISRYIPLAYSALEEKFYGSVIQRKLQNKINIYEWFIDERWTMHSKGLWISDFNSSPFLMTIGSPNLGRRSADRDIEAQICILTRSKEMQLKIKDELDNLLRPGTKITEDIFTTPKRKVPYWIKPVVNIFGNYL